MSTILGNGHSSTVVVPGLMKESHRTYLLFDRISGRVREARTLSTQCYWSFPNISQEHPEQHGEEEPWILLLWDWELDWWLLAVRSKVVPTSETPGWLCHWLWAQRCRRSWRQVLRSERPKWWRSSQPTAWHTPPCRHPGQTPVDIV